MNSTAKGNEFEKKILSLLTEMIQQGRFPISRHNCKIFSKKGYYSNDRKGNIIFDIAIEVYNPGSKSVAMLYLVECKNYAHSVPVDDGEEFFAKMHQVSASKGIIVSRGPFQSGTIKFCESKRIGLLRYFPPSNVKWELHRSSSAFWINPGRTGDPASLHRDLIADDVRSRFDFCGRYNGRATNSLHDLFHHIAEDAMDPAMFAMAEHRGMSRLRTVDYLTTKFIESKASSILSTIGYRDGAVSLDAVCDWQNLKSGLVVSHNAAPDGRKSSEEILGRLSFDPLEITVFATAERNEARERFTLAHELSHLLLGHNKYMKGETSQESDLDPNVSSLAESEELARLEWQANQLASSLLLPLEPLARDFWALIQKHGLEQRSFGFLYADEQPCNLAIFQDITGVLKSKYKVSRTVVKIRLERLKLITDGFRKPAQIGMMMPRLRRGHGPAEAEE